MQPCNRDMKPMNSLINPSSQTPLLPDLQNQTHSQIQNPHFGPSSASTDDFLDQMLSTIPSCSWADLKPTDISGETAAADQENGGFHGYDESVILASRTRQQQINGGGAPSTAAAVAAAKIMLQQQLMMATGGGIAHYDVVDDSSFKSPVQGGDGSMQALYNEFNAQSLHGAPQHFHHSQLTRASSFGAPGPVMNQTPANGLTDGEPVQPKPRVRARRGQATDPHSIAERLRRERIAERMKGLQELVPNANKTDKASMLDEIIDYVKFLQLQVKVLSMSRLGGAGAAAATAPLGADLSSEGGVGSHARTSDGKNQTASSSGSLTMTEHQVLKLMEEDMGSAMQYLQGKGLCLMPISLATAISTATSNRNPIINNGYHLLFQSNGEGPSSPSMSALTVQSVSICNGASDGSIKDAASVSKP